MAISYQTRRRGAPGKEKTSITVTVRCEGVSSSATFPRMDLARSWGVNTQNAILRARQLDVPFDKEAARPRGRRRTVNETTDDERERHFLRNPDEDARPRADWSLRRAFEHYRDTVTPGKKSSDREEVRIGAWIRRPLAAKRLNELTPTDVQTLVNGRVAAGRAAMTIRNETFLLSALYRHAARLPPPPPNNGPASGWGLVGLKNPVVTVELPKPPTHRRRRLQSGDAPGLPGEEQRMRDALREGPDGEVMDALFVLAVETGMRLSELLSVTPSNIRAEDGARYIALTDSKNGDPRNVVLSSKADAVILALMPGARASGRPLLPLSVTAVEYRWSKARRAARVSGLRFHDLRHEGLSRMANRHLTLGELQAQSGHRTAQVLLRYINARVSEVARKLG